MPVQACQWKTTQLCLRPCRSGNSKTKHLANFGTKKPKGSNRRWQEVGIQAA